MARKAGQLISRGPHTWLVRVSLGRDPEMGIRKYHNKTIRGSFREAQTYLSGKLQPVSADERHLQDVGIASEAAEGEAQRLRRGACARPRGLPSVPTRRTAA